MTLLLIGIIGSILPLLILLVIGLLISKAVTLVNIKAKMPILLPVLCLAMLFSLYLFVYCGITHSLWIILAIFCGFVETFVAAALKATFIDSKNQVPVIIRYSAWHASALAVALAAITLALFL